MPGKLANLISVFLNRKDTLIPLLYRYLFYGIGSLEGFLLPLILNLTSYGEFEYFKNLIFIFPNFLLGSYSGFVMIKYSFKVDYFPQLIKIGVIFSCIVALAGSLILKEVFLLLPIFIICLFTLLEQRLKVDRAFLKAFAFKPIFSIVSISLAYYLYKTQNNHFNPTVNLFYIYLFSFLLWIVVFKIPLFTIGFNFSINKITWLRYFCMIKIIFTGVLASFLYALLLFFERYCINKYYVEILPTYSLSFNMSQIIVIILSTISYISSVEYGENMYTIKKFQLWNSFKRALSIYIILFIFFTIAVYFISLYYKDFSFLVPITIIVSFSKGFLALVGIFSPLVVYHNYNNAMLYSLLIFGSINVLIAFLIIYFGYGIFVLLIANSFFIILYSFYILHLLFRKIKFVS